MTVHGIPQFVTVREFANLLRVSEHTIYRLVRNYKVHKYKFGEQSVRFKKTDVLEFIEKCCSKNTDTIFPKAKYINRSNSIVRRLKSTFEKTPKKIDKVIQKRKCEKWTREKKLRIKKLKLRKKKKLKLKLLKKKKKVLLQEKKLLMKKKLAEKKKLIKEKKQKRRIHLPIVEQQAKVIPY